MKKLLLFFLIQIVVLNIVGNQLVLATAVPTVKKSSEITVYRQKIKAILKKNEFNYRGQLPWLKALPEWLQNFFKNLWAPKTQIKMKIPAWVTWLGYLALLIGLIFIGYSLKNILQKNTFLEKKSPKSHSPLIKSVNYLEKAEHFAASGGLRQAIRFLYLVSLEKLQQKKLLPNGFQITDRDNLRILAKKFPPNDPVLRAFEHLLQIFQEKWYGGRSCLTEEYWLAKESLHQITEFLKNK